MDRKLLSPELLHKMDAYRRAANYLSVGQMEIVRAYLPPDANCLRSVVDHCLRSRHYVNVVVAGRRPAPQWLNMDQAIEHCAAGIGIWQWKVDPTAQGLARSAKER
jgi:phosphoketolase